jgi:hypothetical protein
MALFFDGKALDYLLHTPYDLLIVFRSVGIVASATILNALGENRDVPSAVLP